MFSSLAGASVVAITFSVAQVDGGISFNQLLGAVQARQTALMSSAVTIHVADRGGSPAWPDSEMRSVARLGQTFRYDVRCTASAVDETANIDEVVFGDGCAIMRWVPAHARADVWPTPASSVRNALPSSFLFSLWWPSFAGLEEFDLDVGAMILSGEAVPSLAGAPEGVFGAAWGSILGRSKGKLGSMRPVL